MRILPTEFLVQRGHSPINSGVILDIHRDGEHHVLLFFKRHLVAVAIHKVGIGFTAQDRLPAMRFFDNFVCVPIFDLGIDKEIDDRPDNGSR